MPPGRTSPSRMTRGFALPPVWITALPLDKPTTLISSSVAACAHANVGKSHRTIKTDLDFAMFDVSDLHHETHRHLSPLTNRRPWLFCHVPRAGSSAFFPDQDRPGRTGPRRRG